MHFRLQITKPLNLGKENIFTILFFEKFCKYDHVVSVFTDRWYIGLGYISWILFMALTVFYSHKYKSIITATIENKSLIDNSNLLTNVKRLTISLIIMECWNWAGLLVPIWSVYYFINFTRPNEEYFYEFFITPEAIDQSGILYNTQQHTTFYMCVTCVLYLKTKI